MDVTRRAKEESRAEYEAYVNSNGLYCHGDYQYHNVLFGRESYSCARRFGDRESTVE